MDLLRDISGHVFLGGSLVMLAIRYLVRATDEQKRRVYGLVQWPWGVSCLIYTWLQPWREQGPNVFRIIVYVSLGLGALTLIDYVVDRYRGVR